MKIRNLISYVLIWFSLIFVVKIFAQGDVTGERELPDWYDPGGTVDVIINIDITDDTHPPTGLIVTETPPSGWTITSSSPPFDSVVDGTYKWLFYGGDVVDRNITYTASVPPTSSGEQYFSGKLKYNDVDTGAPIEDDIGGDTVILTSVPPQLAVSPDTLNFGTDETALQFTVTNTGGANLEWEATVSQSWLSIETTSGVLGTGESENITANVDRTGLEAGTHTATIDFTSNNGTSTINVILIVGSPSPVKSFSAYGVPGGIYLLWENPDVYTGTIAFRRIGSPITANPVDGIYYDVPGNPDGYPSNLSDGSECIFKDDTVWTDYFDDITNDTDIYYRIYSYSDINYSTPLEANARPQPLLANPEIDDFSSDFDYLLDGTTTPMDGFELIIPENSLTGTPPASFNLGNIDSDYAPAHPGLLGFANIYGVLTDNINLVSPINIKIPVHQTDLDAAGISKIEDLKVYQWNSDRREWEELNIVDIEETGAPDPIGYITVEVEDMGEMNYFSSGYPFIPSGGGGGGCFIATAAYGTAMAKEVIILKKFRDKYLLKNKLGRAFVRWYYKHSPKYARIIRKKPVLKAIVRIGLKPLIAFCKILPY